MIGDRGWRTKCRTEEAEPRPTAESTGKKASPRVEACRPSRREGREAKSCRRPRTGQAFSPRLTLAFVLPTHRHTRTHHTHTHTHIGDVLASAERRYPQAREASNTRPVRSTPPFPPSPPPNAEGWLGRRIQGWKVGMELSARGNAQQSEIWMIISRPFWKHPLIVLPPLSPRYTDWVGGWGLGAWQPSRDINR